MAALGLLALLPLGLSSKPLNTPGVLYGLVAGGCWATYIYFGRKAGAAHGGQIAALGMVVGSIVILPIGAVQAGAQLLSPAILPTALAVALLSSALPYSLERRPCPCCRRARSACSSAWTRRWPRSRAYRCWASV